MDMLRILSIAALAANIVWLGWVGYAWIVNEFRPQMWQDVVIILTPMLSIVPLFAYILTSGDGLLSLWVRKKRAELNAQINHLK